MRLGQSDSIDYSQAFGLDVGAAMPTEAPTVSSGPTDWNAIFSGANQLLQTGAQIALTQEQLNAAQQTQTPARIVQQPAASSSLLNTKNLLLVGGALLAGFAVMSLVR
jgi:hypothetical protein